MTPETQVFMIILGMFVGLDLVLLRHVIRKERLEKERQKNKDKIIIFDDISFLSMGDKGIGKSQFINSIGETCKYLEDSKE